jgi:hypothetical protein
MKIIFLSALVLLMAVGCTTTPARAAGCLNGAAVGGVAGHFAGHHDRSGLDGSKPMAAATSKYSRTSKRRSPSSYLAT